MTILAIDTAAAACAACIYDETTGRELARAVEDIGKGHAERIMPLIGAALVKAGLGYSDLTKVAVSVGPGSFTGVRVGVSAARGLGLALSCPVIGVSTLEAMGAEARERFPERAMLAINKAADRFAVAGMDTKGTIVHEPALMTLDEARKLALSLDAVLVGNAAEALALTMPEAAHVAGREATADIAFYARLAAQSSFTPRKPVPLYLRQFDAKIAVGFALPLKDV